MERNQIESRLCDLTNGLGPFAPSLDSDYDRVAERMKKEIDNVDCAIRGKNDPELEYQLSIAIRNYTAWYVRGGDRKPLLERTVEHLRNAVGLSDHPAAKVELARTLIEEKLVRDLDAALTLADDLKQKNLLPEWMNSIVEKAKRWAGKIDVPKDTSFANLDAAPASLREERTRLRKLLAELIKTKDIAKATPVARRLYNLGLLAAYLYDDFDGSSGVMGSAFDAAAKKFPKARKSFNFDYLGRISDASFLTSTDYGRIEKLLGTTNNSVTVRQIRSMV